MGYSTFIEINNDSTNEIQANSDEFMKELLNLLHYGKGKPIGIIRSVTVHRNDIQHDAIIHEMDPL